MASSPSEISDLLTQITTDVRSIVADEIALVKAEIKPTVRRVGVGAGMFGAAGYFAVSATIILWLTMAAGFAWMYASLTALSPWATVFFGTLTAFFVMLVIAGVFVFIGARSFSGIQAPQKTPDTVEQAINALHSGVATGLERVSSEVRPSSQASPWSDPTRS